MANPRAISRASYARSRSRSAASDLRSSQYQFSSTTRQGYVTQRYAPRTRASVSQTVNYRRDDTQRRDTTLTQQRYDSDYRARTISARGTSSGVARARYTTSYTPTYLRTSTPYRSARPLSSEAGPIRRTVRAKAQTGRMAFRVGQVGVTLGSAVSGLISGEERESDAIPRTVRDGALLVGKGLATGTVRVGAYTVKTGYRFGVVRYGEIKDGIREISAELSGKPLAPVLSPVELAALRQEKKASALTSKTVLSPTGKKVRAAGAVGSEASEILGEKTLKKRMRTAGRFAMRTSQLSATALHNVSTYTPEALVQEAEVAIVKKTTVTTAKGVKKGGAKVIKHFREKRKARALAKTRSAMMSPSKKVLAPAGAAKRGVVKRTLNAVGTYVQRVVSSLASKLGAVVAAKLGVVLGVVLLLVAVISVISPLLSVLSWFEEEKKHVCVAAVDVPPHAIPWVSKVSQASGIPSTVVAAIMKQESSFDPNAENAVTEGHYGLVQMSPTIWTTYGGPVGRDAHGRPNGIRNIDLYLKVAGDYLKGRWANVASLRQAHPDAPWVRELSMTDSFIVAHNAGEGWLYTYPFIPAETSVFIEAVRAATNAASLVDMAPGETACQVPGGVANGNAIVDAGKALLGTPYVWGGNTPEEGLDCSGFVRWVFSGQGVSLPRVANDQGRVGNDVYSGSGWTIPWEKLKPGDAIAFGQTSSHYHHIGIYAGGNQMIHAPQPGDVVKFAPLDIPYWQSFYWSVRRY